MFTSRPSNGRARRSSAGRGVGAEPGAAGECWALAQGGRQGLAAARPALGSLRGSGKAGSSKGFVSFSHRLPVLSSGPRASPFLSHPRLARVSPPTPRACLYLRPSCSFASAPLSPPHSDTTPPLSAPSSPLASRPQLPSSPFSSALAVAVLPPPLCCLLCLRLPICPRTRFTLRHLCPARTAFTSVLKF